MSIAGTVVILNGPPHAGKTSIIEKVQSVADKPYYAVGIDQLFNIVEPVESVKSVRSVRLVKSVECVGSVG